MKYHLFNSDETEQLFKQNSLAEFEQLWALDCEWFEEPNYRRNGWSGVVKFPLKDQNGNFTYIFIKRQENHNVRTFAHPIRGIPTFQREYLNILRLNEINIPTLTCLYYGERTINGNDQSILVTISLEGYQSMEDYFESDITHSEETTRQIMKAAGKNIRLLHDANYQHGSLYPKHFFISTKNNIIDVRLIDLESLIWSPIKVMLRYNDLSRFIRRCGGPMPRPMIKLFLESYLNTGKKIKQSYFIKKLFTMLEENQLFFE